jgi:hypothetical protein
MAASSPVRIISHSSEETPWAAPTAAELRERAEGYRRSAAHWRMLVEREERQGGGYARLPSWPETKAMMLEMADCCERDAENALVLANTIPAVCGGD